MVWGCITPWGVGRLHRIKGNMDSKQYCSILEQSLLGTLQDYSLPQDSIIFQHDNDRKHTTRHTKEWLHNHNITVLPWPSSSPDMNIIEHVWDELDCRIHHRNPLPQNLKEQEWYGLENDFISKLYHSLPEHVRALRKAQGGHTHY